MKASTTASVWGAVARHNRYRDEATTEAQNNPAEPKGTDDAVAARSTNSCSRFKQRRLALGCILVRVQLEVASTLRNQLLVAALLDDTTAVDYDD